MLTNIRRKKYASHSQRFFFAREQKMFASHIPPVEAIPPHFDIFAVYIPRNVADGRCLADLLTSKHPQAKHYAMLLSVFFRFVAVHKSAPRDKEVYCESVMKDGVTMGMRYYFLVKDASDCDPDDLVLNEVINFFSEHGNGNERKFKNDKKRLLKLYRTLFRGVYSWLNCVQAIMPGVTYHEMTEHPAKECFSLKRAGIDIPEGFEFQFEDPQYVLLFKNADLLGVDELLFPEVLLKKLQLQRYSPTDISKLVLAFKPPSDEDEGRPLKRHRGDSAASPKEQVQVYLPLYELRKMVEKITGYFNQLSLDDERDLRVTLREFVDRRLCDSFDLELSTSTKRSRAEEAYQAFRDGSFVFDGREIPNSSNVWMKKVCGGKGQMTFFKAFLAAMDGFYFVDRNHAEILRLLLFSRDSSRYEFGSLHLSEFMHSKRGGVGKSKMLSMLFFLCISNTAFKINRFTPASFAVHGREGNENNPNQCGSINIGDDWDPSLFSNDPKAAAIQAALKTILSDQIASLQALALKEEGQRTQQLLQAPVVASWFVAFNADKITSHPMKRRANDTSASEATSSTLDETILQSWTSKEARDAFEVFRLACQSSQLWTYWVHQLQYVGLLPEICMEGATHFLSAVFKYLKKSPEAPWFSRIDPSFLERVKALSKILTIDYITTDSFCLLDDKEITIEDIMNLKPRMYCPVQCAASALTMLMEEWFSPLKFAVFDALKRVFRKKIEERPDLFDMLFWSDYADGKRIPDFNWIRLSKQETAEQIAHEVCHMMGGDYVPNQAKIEEIFDSFTDLPPAEVGEYYRVHEFARALGKRGVSTKTANRFNVVGGKKLNFDYLKIHVSIFEDLVLMEGVSDQFIGLGESFTNQLHIFETTKKVNGEFEIDFERIGARQIPDSIRHNHYHSLLNSWVEVASKDATKEIIGLLKHINENDAFDEYYAEDVMIQQLRKSIFWDPAYEGMSWKDIMIEVKKTEDSFIIEEVTRKYEFYYATRYEYDPRSQAMIEIANTDKQSYEIHWFLKNTAIALPNNPEKDYRTTSHDLVEKAMKAAMAGKNQFKREVYGGPDPQEPHKMRTFIIGDIDEDAPAYDPTKGFSYFVKKRDHDSLGEFLRHLVPSQSGKIKIPYDLDILSQEVHLEKLGLNNVIITPTVFDEISSRLSGDLDDEFYEGKYLHGVPLSELAPLSAFNIELSAQKVKNYLNDVPDEHYDNDLYFPESLSSQQSDLITKMGKGYFHFDDEETDDFGAVCWTPFLRDSQ